MGTNRFKLRVEDLAKGDRFFFCGNEFQIIRKSLKTAEAVDLATRTVHDFPTSRMVEIEDQAAHVHEVFMRKEAMRK